MKKNQKKIKIKKISNPSVRICPQCGFSFRPIDPKTNKKIKICPMCGYKFIDPNNFPKNLRKMVINSNE